MQGRNWLVALVAAMIGIVAVILVNSWITGTQERTEKAAEEQKLVQIVVATQPFEFGTQLTAQNIKLQAWPAASVPEGAFTRIPDALRDNRVALRPIVVGEPILASKVSGKDGRATLAALLPDGMRAVSIPVTAVHGVSGFVLPGTMVDVLLTRQIEGEGAKPSDLRSDVVLQNVQVLAADQLASDKADKPKVSRTVTLAVALSDAQRLEIAQKLGTLSLALRKVENAAESGRLVDQGSLASTVTTRQMGGRHLFIPKRAEGGVRMAYPAPAQPAMPGAVPGTYSGPTMTVFRGAEPTTYPVGR